MADQALLQKKIALLWGGWSEEREISHDSATACCQALKKAGFGNVVMLDVADNHFLTQLTEGAFDVAFIAMHGPFGEDGCIQGLLEILHIPYTFSGVLANALASDKARAKAVFKAADLDVPASVSVSRDEFEAVKKASEKPGAEFDFLGGLLESADTRALADFTWPLFVKPANNGSSYGITKVAASDKEQGGTQLKAAIELALTKGDVALVEEAIEGVEISVPVLGKGGEGKGAEGPQATQATQGDQATPTARALPIIEIVTDSEFYDLTTKYEPSELHHIIPARLEKDVYLRAQEAAVTAHEALGCSGCSRSDFIVDKKGVPYLLETNTIPGMTETSLLPDSAKRDGIDFPALCTFFVKQAACETK